MHDVWTKVNLFDFAANIYKQSTVLVQFLSWCLVAQTQGSEGQVWIL